MSQGERNNSKSLDCLGAALVALLIFATQYLIFVYVPNERLMGPIQRVFYFHVGSALATYVAFGILLIASLGYLATRSEKHDCAAEGAGEVGFIFCTITLVSGMIWGHTAWNTWFRWEEPRLVTFLLLWLISLSYNLLRHFGDPRAIGRHAAVLGILGALTVPLVVFSIKYLPQSAQLHPQIIENQGLKDPSFVWTLIVSIIALICFQCYLIWLRTRLARLQRLLS